MAHSLNVYNLSTMTIMLSKGVESQHMSFTDDFLYPEDVSILVQSGETVHLLKLSQLNKPLVELAFSQKEIVQEECDQCQREQDVVYIREDSPEILEFMKFDELKESDVYYVQSDHSHYCRSCLEQLISRIKQNIRSGPISTDLATYNI